MAKKPDNQEVPMTALNIDIPTETSELMHVAKAVLGKSLREIAQEALETWLKQHGLTKETLNRLKPKQ